MLSHAHPITNLFETIDTKPMNYLQAVQELMVADPSVPPEYQDTRYEETTTPIMAESEMVLDMNKIDKKSIRRYRSAFHKLGEFVARGKTEVIFPGLDAALKLNTKSPCCTWSCLHLPSPKRELMQL